MVANTATTASGESGGSEKRFFGQATNEFFVLGLTDFRKTVILVPVVMDSSIGVWSCPSLFHQGQSDFCSHGCFCV
ncbi:MAG: hypothetical protein KAV00_10460, partial [Phycisphaerae bacterium]|nr:hypothetical protein [Phycisphaerae bacterium]